MRDSGFDITGEKWMPATRPGREFRVKLTRDEPGVLRQLNDNGRRFDNPTDNNQPARPEGNDARARGLQGGIAQTCLGRGG